VCRAIQWDGDIDAEGGVSNDMWFRNLVLLDVQKENWIELPVAQVWSGQSLLWNLTRDERTSTGTTLESLAGGARILKPRLKFANRPSREHPVSFCLRNYDINAFSMNTEEFKARPDFNADGIDFAEKLIEEDVGLFTLTLRIPLDMKLARAPYFEVYKYNGDVAQLHDGLTSALQPFFQYSVLLRTAMLRIPNPAAPYGYRISWQLGDPEAMPTDANAVVRKRRWELAARMLEAREFFLKRSMNPVAAKWSELIATALTSFAEYVRELVMEKLGADAKLDAKLLSVSLMVLGADRKQLVIAAGNTTDPSFTLDVGDGNAGRAWRRRVARIYDKAEAESKDNTYFPNEARPPHEILFSIPLIDPVSIPTIHGIVNIGTYDEGQAELLRVIKDRESIEKLSSKAQSYVLQRFISEL
jgi:hypothetical protein